MATHINNLLPENKLDIFSRLPAESVLSCKQVCKPWETLLSDPAFVGLHLRKQLDDPKVSDLDFLVLIKFDKENRQNQLWLSSFDDDKSDYKTSKMIKQLNPSINMNSIVGSSNGLICMSLSQTPYGMYDPVYICNPVIREYVKLPCYTNSWYGLIYSGFGYVESTNEYKVVRIYYGQDKSVGKVQVYTLGDGNGWRNKPDLNCYMQYNYAITRGLLFNGAIHWMDEKLNFVIFNLEDEKFYELPSPYSGKFPSYNLAVLGGCLCFIVYGDGGLMELWFLMENNSEELDGEPTWGWTKGSIVSTDHPNYTPFSLTKRGILMWREEGGLCLYRYDPQTASIESLARQSEGLSSFESISHINSFVSLKAIGEDAKTN